MKVKIPENSVYHDKDYGPIFGTGNGERESFCDICINDNCNEFVSSSSNLGEAFECPKGMNESSLSGTGSGFFRVKEIEIY
jgi:hypothetical protein